MRVGIMSFAHVHADGFLQLLRSLPDTEFVGFSDTDEARGKKFSELYNTTWFDTHEALLKTGVDAVIVCSENANHRELVELAARAGAHVLCEKPIEVTVQDAEAMKGVCTKAGVNFMTAFPMRFDANIQALKGMLERNDLGKLYAINGINHSEIPKAHRAWFAIKALAGGGAVMDHTVHLLDLYRWFTGSEVTEVYAEVSNPFYPGEIDVDSAGLVTLTFANGMFATIDCSWSRPPMVYPRWGHLKMELIGENGAVNVDAFAQHLNVYSKTAARPASWLGWGSDANAAMVQEFLASIREKREPAVIWRDGLEAMRVALACYESAKDGQPVTLTL
jgi:UDP-N-acetylglucosamine 3-dehydrogenase